MAARHTPWAPPLVEMATGMVGHLLAWERHERDGSWWAWVSCVHEAGSRPVHKLVCVPAESLTPTEAPPGRLPAGAPEDLRNGGRVRYGSQRGSHRHER